MPPPRVVPEEILERIVPRMGTLTNHLVGGACLLFGVVLCLLFFPFHLPQQFRLNRGPVEFVKGKIITAEDTGAAENEDSVWRYGFVFQPRGNMEQRGIAHTTGEMWGVGSLVDIRYLPTNPKIATPVGARLDRTPVWAAIVLIFPLIGSYCVIRTLYDLKRKKRLLSDGLVGKAIINSLEKSRFHSEGQDEYVLRMTRVEDGIQVRRRIRTNAEIHVAKAKLKSGKPLILIYDKNNPERSLIVESWDANVGAKEGLNPERP